MWWSASVEHYSPHRWLVRRLESRTRSPSCTESGDPISHSCNSSSNGSRSCSNNNMAPQGSVLLGVIFGVLTITVGKCPSPEFQMRWHSARRAHKRAWHSFVRRGTTWRAPSIFSRGPFTPPKGSFMSRNGTIASPNDTTIPLEGPSCLLRSPIKPPNSA